MELDKEIGFKKIIIWLIITLQKYLSSSYEGLFGKLDKQFETTILIVYMSRGGIDVE